MMRQQTRSRALLLAVTCLATCFRRADGHGWLQVPSSRNWLHNGQDGFYQEMSLNDPGTGGFCGGVQAGDSRFSAGGLFAKGQVVKTYTAGETIPIKIQIWTNHWGYFQLRLCPLSSSSTSAEKAELTEACLNKHALPLSGGQGSKYWIYKGQQGDNFVINTAAKLPSGVSCDRCILQWRWITAHMCSLPGEDPAFVARTEPGLPACPKNYQVATQKPPEKFFNCADIRITGGSKPKSAPKPKTKPHRRPHPRPHPKPHRKPHRKPHKKPHKKPHAPPK